MDVEIAKITDIIPHPNADRLEIAKVKNWNVIVAKDSYTVGENIVYIHPDAQLNCELEWVQPMVKFLGSRGRVRTVKLRGVFSEGIALKLQEINVHYPDINENTTNEDLANILGVVHYEPPVERGNNMRSCTLPYGLCKTDQINVQDMLPDDIYEKSYYITRKKDGSSCTVTLTIDELGVVDVHVTSRRFDLKLDQSNNFIDGTKAFVQRLLNAVSAKDTTILNLTPGIVNVFRGEVCGIGINDSKVNKDAKAPLEYFLYEAFTCDIHGDNVKHYNIFKDDTFKKYCNVVPVVEVTNFLNENIVESYLNAPAEEGEGVVFWEFDNSENITGFSFKIRSKDYDSKLH